MIRLAKRMGKRNYEAEGDNSVQKTKKPRRVVFEALMKIPAMTYSPTKFP
jgi:hypothetical protein